MDDSEPRSRSPWLRIAYVLAPALAFVALLAFGMIRSSAAPTIGDPAPDFEADLLSGDGTLALSELKGRPIVMNFWASWCLPCEDEAPMLRNAHERYGDEVAFVGVDVRDARTDALEFVDEHGLDFFHVRDENGKIYADYGLTGQPETFILDADGRIFEHVQGPFLSEDDLFGLLERVAGEP